LANAWSIHSQRWVKYLAERGHEVHIISFEHPDIELEGVNTHIIKTRKKYLYISSPYKCFQFRRIINNIKPDILHAHVVTKYGIMGSFSGFHPFVVSALGSDMMIHSRKSKILRMMAKFVLKRADCVICDAEHIKEPLIELGTDPKKINLIYFGTDTQKFQPAPKDQQLLTKLDINTSPTVISLRNLQPLYDVESLIRAIPMILKDVPAAKFIIAADGPQKKYLQKLAAERGVADSTKFVGMIANDELPRYLNSADICVSTSLSDGGLAASTAEAMACGLPVVITDFGDNGKWVEDGVNGYLVPLQNPEALAEKLIFLLQHEYKRQEFGQANRRVIEERNNWVREMNKMEQLYDILIKRYEE